MMYVIAVLIGALFGGLGVYFYCEFDRKSIDTSLGEIIESQSEIIKCYAEKEAIYDDLLRTDQEHIRRQEDHIKELNKLLDAVKGELK